jgi:hypothetical protein
MAHDGSRNYNNGDDNNVENQSSMLEHLLIVRAQLLWTVQQVMVQMQDINQLMQSMEVRPSSRKRKSNAQDDVGHAATQNPKGKKCYNCGHKVTFLFNAPNLVLALFEHRYLLWHHHPTRKPKEGESAFGRLRPGRT